MISKATKAVWGGSVGFYFLSDYRRRSILRPYLSAHLVLREIA